MTELASPNTGIAPSSNFLSNTSHGFASSSGVWAKEPWKANPPRRIKSSGAPNNVGSVGNHNYYWYEARSSDRMWLIPWDLDSSLTENDDDFETYKPTMRGESRLGLGVRRPYGLGWGELKTGS